MLPTIFNKNLEIAEFLKLRIVSVETKSKVENLHKDWNLLHETIDKIHNITKYKFTVDVRAHSCEIFGNGDSFILETANETREAVHEALYRFVASTKVHSHENI